MSGFLYIRLIDSLLFSMALQSPIFEFHPVWRLKFCYFCVWRLSLNFPAWIVNTRIDLWELSSFEDVLIPFKQHLYVIEFQKAGLFMEPKWKCSRFWLSILRWDWASDRLWIILPNLCVIQISIDVYSRIPYNVTFYLMNNPLIQLLLANCNFYI